MKKQIELSKAKWLVEPGCVVLVTSGTLENANVMTFSWQTNVPGQELLEQTHFVGTVTGRNIDKFKESGLTPIAARIVEPPLIEECVAHLECRVVETFKMQTHDLLVCEVVRAVADTELFDGKWIPEKFHTLHYLGGNKYGLMERAVEAHGKKTNVE